MYAAVFAPMDMMDFHAQFQTFAIPTDINWHCTLKLELAAVAGRAACATLITTFTLNVTSQNIPFRCLQIASEELLQTKISSSTFESSPPPISPLIPPTLLSPTSGQTTVSPTTTNEHNAQTDRPLLKSVYQNDPLEPRACAAPVEPPNPKQVEKETQGKDAARHCCSPRLKRAEVLEETGYISTSAPAGDAGVMK